MTVKRYDINECASTGMDLCSDGAYVTYDEYEDLKNEYSDLCRKYDKMMEKISDIWREG